MINSLFRYLNIPPAKKLTTRVFLAACIRQLFPSITASRDYRKRNFIRSSFNGQKGRQAIFFELATRIPPACICETGTFFGNTTEFFCQNFSCPIFSIELIHHPYLFSKLRLKSYSQLQLFYGDSRKHLKKILNSSF